MTEFSHPPWSRLIKSAVSILLMSVVGNLGLTRLNFELFLFPLTLPSLSLKFSRSRSTYKDNRRVTWDSKFWVLSSDLLLMMPSSEVRSGQVWSGRSFMLSWVKLSIVAKLPGFGLEWWCVFFSLSFGCSFNCSLVDPGRETFHILRRSWLWRIILNVFSPLFSPGFDE